MATFKGCNALRLTYKRLIGREFSLTLCGTVVNVAENIVQSDGFDNFTTIIIKIKL